MKTIPPSTFPQYSNGSAPLLRKVARINNVYINMYINMNRQSCWLLYRRKDQI